jgi:hypothetical protein
MHVTQAVLFGQIQDGAAGVGGLDLHHVACDRNRLDVAFGLLDGEDDDRAARTADHLHDLVDRHVGDIDGWLAFLGYGNDQISSAQAAVAPAGAARHQLFHYDVVILFTQHGTDALERAGERDVQVLLLRGRQILGVRVVSRRDRIEERLGGVEWIGREQPREAGLEARGNFLSRLLLASLQRGGDL